MKRVFDILSRLASSLYQQKYVVNGSSDEYVLPDQLLDEAIAYISTVISNSKASSVFKDKQIRDLARLLQELERNSAKIPFDDESVSNEELVLHNENWLDARNSANEFLKKNEFDLKAWEKKHICMN